MGRGRGKGKRSNSRKESNQPPAKRRNQVDAAITVTRESRRGGRVVRDQGRRGNPPTDQVELRQEENSNEPLKRQDIIIVQAFYQEYLVNLTLIATKANSPDFVSLLWPKC